MSSTILFVEDNRKLSENISLLLREEGYTVETAHFGREALQKMQYKEIDLVLLDLSLPDMDGIAVCREIRTRKKKIPILMLTARIDLDSKVEGLDEGADDYLTKPFEIEELLARIRSLLRRREKETQLQCGNLRILPEQKRIFIEEEEVSCTPHEFRILRYLMEHQEAVQSAENIITEVWGEDNEALFSDTLKVHISSLRKKIGKEKIKTVVGFGYMLTYNETDTQTTR